MENSNIRSVRFQQSGFWAEFKCAHGWKRVSAEGVSVLVRTFRAGALSASLAYVPMAPEMREGEGDEAFFRSLGELAGRLRPKLPGTTFCVRFDVPVDFPTAAEAAEFARKAGGRVRKSRVDVQPPDTVLLDLGKDEVALLAGMKPKWRYNVRYAAKKGVQVRAVHAGDENFSADMESFYSLYKTTAERDGIGLHPMSYYVDLMERGNGSDGSLATLYVASHEGADLAAIITLFQKDEAVYLYGCSGNEKRNLMPAYLLQWTAIRDARNFGSKVYDFYGIPPTGDEGHPMHGLYLFKTGFGGREVHRPGSFDVPLSPIHSLYAFAERSRAWYHKRLLKKIRGR